MKVKYLTMSESSVYADDQGNFYPDLFTFPIDDFKLRNSPLEYNLTINDIRRFDILIEQYYGYANYDDLVLWLNQINHIADLDVGFKIFLPSKNDLDEYYRTNIK